MPDFDRGEYQVSFKATPGATLRETGNRALEMVARLREMPEVDYTYTTIGEAGSQYRPVTEGTTYVKVKAARGRTFSAALRRARGQVEQVPGLTFGLTEAGAFGQKPIQISVRGADIDELDRISRGLMVAMQEVPGVADVESSLEKSKPELRIDVNRQRASDLGVSRSRRSRGPCRPAWWGRWPRPSRTASATTPTCACGSARTRAGFPKTCCS